MTIAVAFAPRAARCASAFARNSARVAAISFSGATRTPSRLCSVACIQKTSIRAMSTCHRGGELEYRPESASHLRQPDDLDHAGVAEIPGFAAPPRGGCALVE